MNQDGNNGGLKAGENAPAHYAFVELNRTFHEFSKTARETDDFDLSEAFHMRGNLTWADVRKENRVVILSEAGSGKTEEIRQAALKLRAEGKRAFFLRLEHVPDDFEEAFEVGSLEEFESWLKSDDDAWLFLALPDVESQTQFAMRFITRLFGSRRSETTVARPGFRTAEHLKTLYLLMHHYIRRAEDIERAGKGVYSPGLRDDAQDARNKLFDALNKLSGKAAFLAMQEIAENHPDADSRGWLTRLTRQKAEQEADFAPWTPTQVRDYDATLTRTPKNHHELAELALLRLLDLKDDLENGDDSVAAVLQKVTDETEMRNYIGHELREKSFGRYNIPQEEELADAKRPDLRFLGTGFQGPVPVELKLADNWPGPPLFERLERQLAGDYLRDIHSGRGIFALVYRGEKTSWQHPVTGKPINFAELVTALQQHWKELSPKFPNVDDVTVVGIDLTRRFKPPVSD